MSSLRKQQYLFYALNIIAFRSIYILFPISHVPFVILLPKRAQHVETRVVWYAMHFMPYCAWTLVTRGIAHATMHAEKGRVPISSYTSSRISEKEKKIHFFSRVSTRVFRHLNASQRMAQQTATVWRTIGHFCTELAQTCERSSIFSYFLLFLLRGLWSASQFKRPRRRFIFKSAA